MGWMMCYRDGVVLRIEEEEKLALWEYWDGHDGMME